ncbi:MAG: class I SAM-dependent methyltransferase [Chromatiales bacterium]|nr:class I SAM-dependent methyltransferase [Chromatiales bacterium]
MAIDSHAPSIERLRATVAARGLAAARSVPMVGDMAKPGLPPASFDLVWSEGALYNIGIENALRVCHGLLRPGGYLAFTDAVWRKENPPPEVKRQLLIWTTRPWAGLMTSWRPLRTVDLSWSTISPCRTRPGGTTSTRPCNTVSVSCVASTTRMLKPFGHTRPAFTGTRDAPSIFRLLRL